MHTTCPPMTSETIRAVAQHAMCSRCDKGFATQEDYRDVWFHLEGLFGRDALRAAGVGPDELCRLEEDHINGVRANLEMALGRITVNKDVMNGVPCIRGLRIPVATIVGMRVDGGMLDAEILAAYPDLLQEDIDAALLWATAEKGA